MHPEHVDRRRIAQHRCSGDEYSKGKRCVQKPHWDTGSHLVKSIRLNPDTVFHLKSSWDKVKNKKGRKRLHVIFSSPKVWFPRTKPNKHTCGMRLCSAALLADVWLSRCSWWVRRTPSPNRPLAVMWDVALYNTLSAALPYDAPPKPGKGASPRALISGSLLPVMWQWGSSPLGWTKDFNGPLSWEHQSAMSRRGLGISAQPPLL